MSTTGQPNETEDLSTVEEFGDESGQLPTVQGKILDFLERAEMTDAQPVFYLYKYENYVSGEGKAFIQKFEDCDPPDEESIARVHGSGRYLLTLTIPKSKGGKRGLTRMYRFRVHPSFKTGDNLLMQSTAPAPAFMAPPAQPAGNGMIEAFGMLEKLLVMLVPLFNRPRDENVLGILNQNYEAVNGLMKKQMQENMLLLNEYQRSIADLGESIPMVNEQETQIEETPSIIEQFAPLIQQWLPLLMGSGPQAQAAGTLVRQVPQVQQIMRDKIQLRKIINYLDQTNGPDTTDRILRALKIQRTGARPVQVQQPATAPGSAAAPRKKPAARKRVASK